MKQQLQEQQNWLSTASLVVLAVVATAMTLHYTRDILVPFVVAIFIGSIFAPVMDVLELRWKFRHSVSVVTALMMIGFVGIVCCLIIANAVQTIVDTSVTYGTKFEELGDSILERVDSMMSFGSGEDQENLPGSSPENQQPPPPEASDPDVSKRPAVREPAFSEFQAATDSAVGRFGPLQSPIVTPLIASPIPTRAEAETSVAPASFTVPDSFEEHEGRGRFDEIDGARDTPSSGGIERLPAGDNEVLENAGTTPAIEKDPIDKNAPRKRALREFLRTLAPRFASWAAASLINIFAGGTLTLIFVMFVMAGRSPHIVRKGVYREIDTQIRAYIGVKVALSLSTGLLVWLSLRLLSSVFDYDAGFGQLAFVFGLTAFLLNFIPSVGSVIATLIPLPFALAEVKTLFVADAFVGGADIAWLLAVLIVPGSIQMLIGNVIEPKVLGDGLNLHPIAILLALAVWGLLWGPIGMLLAVPMTAIIRIVLMRFEITRPAGRLLAGELPGFDDEPATA